MKISFKLIIWIVLGFLSIAGGMTMYLINENEGIFEIWDDRNLFLNLSISILSVTVFLFASYELSKFAPRILPLKERTVDYFVTYFCLQFMISGGGSMLIAIAFAAGVVYINSGLWLGDTSYFSVDFFFVCLAVIFVQLLLFIVYFLFSFKQINGFHDSYEFDAEADYVRLLDEVRVFQLGLGEQQYESEYLKELDGIDVADIDYIYSENSVRYIQSSTRGKTMFDGDTLENLIALLPKEEFFIAARHLIVSRRAIVSSERLADYTILLKLNPPTHLKTKLSEAATRLFKSWYHDGGVNGLDN